MTKSKIDTLTLYTNKTCPFAQRTVIALAEADIPHEAVEIDLQNKPVWYAPNINPASKVPAIVYGGKQADKTAPGSDSAKIAESLVLVEFIADLKPESGLLPEDPVERAKVRFFITLVSDKFSPAWNNYVSKGENVEAVVAAAKAITEAVVGPYALGETWTAADTAIAPFVGRAYLLLKNDTGAWKEGESKSTLEKLSEVKGWDAYVQALLERKSFKESFPSELLLERLGKRYLSLRK